MATSLPPNAISGNALQQQLVNDEAAGAKVYSFDPNASPEAKASKAAKGGDQLKPINASGVGEKELAVDTGKGPAIVPTITIEEIGDTNLPESKQDASSPAAPQASPSSPTQNGQPSQPSSPIMPGDIPTAPAPAIPDWYRVGWRQVSGIDDPPSPDGEQRDKGILAEHINEMYYGHWYHNAAVIFVAVVMTHLITLLRLGWGWLFILLAFCSTYYTTSMQRVRRRARDDIQRELTKRGLNAGQEETAGWLNNFLDRFWLIYEPVLSTTIISSVDQVLSSSTPSFLDSIRMTTFTLGTKAPRIEGIRTYPTTAEDEVLMDWELSFTPSDVSDLTAKQAADPSRRNPKIVLSVRFGAGLATAAMPILLEDINFKGKMQIRLKLITPFPHVQIVEISFLEKPLIDYVLKPIGGETFGFDIGNIPGLSSFIRDQVHATLGPMMYHPAVYTLNLEQILSGAPLDTAIGVLQVTVFSARGLKGSKIGGGSPDPYVALSLNERSVLAKTKYKSDTHNPHWTETKFILVKNLTDQLCLKLWDYNGRHRADFDMGMATFDLVKLEQDATQEGLVQPILKDGKDRGELRFDVSYFPVLTPKKLEDGAEVPVPETQVGIVRLVVHQAKDLDASGTMSGELNPVARVYLKSNPNTPQHVTQKVKHTNNPVWESPTEFLCSNRDESIITVKVIDDRDFLKDPMIGYVSIRLNDLLAMKKDGASGGWSELSKCKKGKLRLSADWKPLDMAGSLHGASAYRPPIGIVRLFIEKGTDLKNVEAALGGKSDPYVRVLGNNVTLGRTEVISNNLSPIWNQYLYIPVHSLKETLVLEAMDYQHLTKDRSLGSLDLRVADIAKESADSKYPYEGKEKKAAAEGLHQDRSSAVKGTLHFTADFIPAMHLADLKFEKSGAEIEGGSDGGESGEGGGTVPDDESVSSSDEEAQRVPDGVTVTYKSHKQKAKSTDTTTGTVASANGGSGSPAQDSPRATTPAKDPDQDAVKLTKEELLTYTSGIVVIDVVGGQLSKKGRLEVLFDSGYWPAFGTLKSRSTTARWDEVGEGFIKELDWSRVWLRLNASDEGKEEIFAEYKCEAKRFLELCLHNTHTFALQGIDGEDSTVQIAAKYVPVPIKLEPAESVNNQGLLRLELVDGKDIHGADRSGKSDPYVVFTMNGQKCHKSEVKKKTLTPVWNEVCEITVPSRVDADFSLEVFDWNQVESDKCIGTARIELADLEPFLGIERLLPLAHEKHGQKGEIRVRLTFQPEIIVKARKNTSTFSTAGRAMTQVGSIPLGAGKGIVSGVGSAGKHVKGMFSRDHNEKASPRPTTPDPPSAQVSEPVAPATPAPAAPSNGTAFPSTVAAPAREGGAAMEAGTLRISRMNAKDISPDGEPLRPYVVLKLGEQEHKTKYPGKTLTPEWDESFAFAAGPETKSMNVAVFEHKTLGRDKPLGEADIDLWKHLQPSTAGPISAADVQVELREGQGLFRMRLEFERGTLARHASDNHSLRSAALSSPSRFSLRKSRDRPPSED